MTRCEWARSEIEIAYHDAEWGVPVHDDERHFEMITLEGAQAGLSWETVLRKRENYRRAFRRFDPARVARMSETHIEKLLSNPDAATSIVRHRGKIESTIENAKAFTRVQESEGSFDAYVWAFVEGTPIVNRWRSLKEVPAKTPLAEAMSKDLKKRGFSFVGPTTCYAYMQAAGLVNDHVVTCYRHGQV